MIKLVVKAADGTRELTLADPTVLIGRAGECGIKLTDLKSSRKHARLEKIGDEWRLTDLESPNGTRLNGRDIDATPINVGDEIRIGETVILVIELDTPPVPVRRPKTEVLQKPAVPIEKKIEVKHKIDDVKRAIDEVRARAAEPVRMKILKRLGVAAAAVVLAVAGAVLVTAVLKEAENSGLKDQIAKRQQKEERESVSLGKGSAEAVLSELRQKAEHAETISDALIRDVAEASLRYGDSMATGQDQVNPFDQLLGALLQRRAEKFSIAFSKTRDAVDAALAARRYSEALSTLAAFKATADASYEEAVRELVEQVDTRVKEDYIATKEYGTRLETSKRFNEAIAHYRLHAPRFEGTIHFAALKDKPQSLASFARAEADAIAARSRPIPAPIPEPANTPSPKPDGQKTDTAAKAEPTGLVAKVIDAVRHAKFTGRTYKFEDGKSGVPLGADADGLLVQTPGGDAKVAWDAIPPAVMFKMCADVLRGDDLLAVADYGHRQGLKAETDQLLVRVLNADRKENKARVDAFVAKTRGLSEPPEGGYTWNAKLGWEDQVQIDNRVAVEACQKNMKELIGSSDGKKRDALFAKTIETYEKPTLLPETREQVKALMVDSIKAWKKKNLEEVTKKAKSVAGLDQLRALKVELNRRRKAALDVIYDAKIYLPEDHPDWRKGDKINGQKQVDDLVGAVREIWERSGSLVIGMNMSIKRDLDEIKEANEKYLAALGVEADTEQELKDFEEITSNLNARLDIKSYSLNGTEAGLYAWNRRVGRYNEACREDGVTAEEKAHATVLNDYREMMGRRRVFLDGRLCKATKKHSAACDKEGRIWHVGSDGSPQSRAQAEGFTAGVAENVAIGYGHPGDVWWQGWYRASDHHRNGLHEAHNCMGYGYVGRVGTQNFSNIGTPRGF